MIIIIGIEKEGKLTPYPSQEEKNGVEAYHKRHALFLHNLKCYFWEFRLDFFHKLAKDSDTKI